MRTVVVYLFLLITFSGCAYQHPLLSKEQYSLIHQEGKYLADNREIIYTAIRQSSKLGALVVIPKDFSDKPEIFPGQSPIDVLTSDERAFEVLRDIPTGNCHFVFSPALASEPMRAPCQLFTEAALSIAKLKYGNEKNAEILFQLKDQVKSNADLTNSIDKRVRAENKVFATALAPVIALVNFNAAQTDALEKQMKLVSGALTNASATQQQANDLLKDTIEKFAQTYSGLKDKLDEISRKLEAIK